MFNKLPPQVWDVQKATLAAASEAMGVPKLASGNVADLADLAMMDRNLLAAHRAGRTAIKEVRPDLPIGVSLAVEDDQAVGSPVRRDAKRAEAYAPWLAAAKGDDFIGMQNYTRAHFDANGVLRIPSMSLQSDLHQEIYPASLGNAVRYVHAEAGVSVMVTEDGVGSSDDRVRANLIPAALAGLQGAIADGVPVIGYMHWPLLDNFEWIFSYKPRFELVEVDRHVPPHPEVQRERSPRHRPRQQPVRTSRMRSASVLCALFALFLAVSSTSSAGAQQSSGPSPGLSAKRITAPPRPALELLYPADAKVAETEVWTDLGDQRVVRNVLRPTLEAVLPDPAKATGAAVIVAPGRGAVLAMANEGWPVARWLAGHGIAAFVLKYRLNQTPPKEADFLVEVGKIFAAAAKSEACPAIREDRATADMLAALQTVRANATRWKVDPNRVRCDRLFRRRHDDDASGHDRA